jgi:hypothetical protein
VIVTIRSDDPRSIKAVEIAAGAGQWLKFHGRDGRKAYGVPSQCHPGTFYLVDQMSCTCPDFRFTPAGRVCKHVLAVRLHCALSRAASKTPSANGTRTRRVRCTPVLEGQKNA